MYGILCFTSKSRVQGFGLPFIEYNTNKEFTVRSKKTYVKDMWAKVHPDTHELMELIGPTGDYKAEVSALRGFYGLHYKYPSSYPPVRDYKPSSNPVKAYTIDQASTLDRDDALSITRVGDEITFGIHITDLARRLSPEWLMWARLRGSSAYWESGTKPIFPPSLAHETLSLTKGHTYPCLSLFYTYKNEELCCMSFGPCDVEITDNLTYDNFATHPDREFFEALSGKKEPTEIVEWCMIQYNLYMAINLPDVLLRVQDETDEPARYDYFGTHETMDARPYTHATSPIRRFADFYNQCMYHNLGTVLTKEEIDELNKRMNDIRAFHQRETVMSLAYEFKYKPCVMEAFVEENDDGRNICLRIKDKRVWIPLSDTYYDEPICQELKNGGCHKIVCFGIHKNGKATLRIRLV